MKTAPYGSWKSPISVTDVASGGVGLGGVSVDGGDIYWLERRPDEGGRSVIVRRGSDGKTEDVTPPPFNARTRVHEYGGGDFVAHDGTVYFSNFADQKIHRARRGEEPEPLTGAPEHRYADMTVNEKRGRLIAVREDHSEDGEPKNEIVAVSLDDGSETVLATGSDFFSSPRISRDGNRFAYLSWNHPNMPWDGTELWVGVMDGDGLPTNARKVAGGEDESIFQPEFSPEGALHFVSDRTGWWNLHREGEAVSLHKTDAEFGLPQWGFGMSTYAFLSDGRIACTYIRDGGSHLASLDADSGKLDEIETPYSVVSGIKSGGNGRVFFRGGSSTEPGSIVAMNVESGDVEVLKKSREASPDSGYLSQPRAIEFPTEDGLTAHAFFYPPKNADYEAASGELPPLVVSSHGGPTAMTTASFDLSLQYWTSRGFAVLDVNYGGSSGYGREYRERLRGNWGVVDVDDCVNGAKYLVERGLVDGERLAITGGSAGGYTTLCALTFRDVFAAGASHFGVSDAEALAKETHKFESRYLDGLIGAYPEDVELYKERSPIHATEKLSCPVIFFQGLEDEVVPPNQAEAMVDALREKGLPVAYVPFEGEQHGFRKSENIERAVTGELYFYSRVFGFETADDIEPVEIENLP
ncbi:MAG: S9 family peptidase [Actinomycetota bacterium]|jgi:dipeptidyl aminopeptidase/acylaminoacyl peptidase|nr:S9 family peptidase [Actinomycetota bacterium]